MPDSSVFATADTGGDHHPFLDLGFLKGLYTLSSFLVCSKKTAGRDPLLS